MQTIILTLTGQKIMFNIRNQIFSHVQKLPMQYFDKNSSGRILTRVTNDVEALNEIYSGVLINLFKDSIMIIGLLVTMFMLDVQMAFISVLSTPLIVLVIILYRVAARKNFFKLKSLIGTINGFLAENISGIKIVRIFNREKEKFEEFKKLNKEYYKTNIMEIVLSGLCRPIVDIINTLTIAAIIWFCSGKIFGGILEIGLLYAFIAYIKQIFEPISEIAEKYTTIQSAFISSERIFEILDIEMETDNKNTDLVMDKLKGEIEFRNVWFAYNEDNWVLKNVSFKIMPGETAAFVGATGSGKSTIINLMARFYDIQKGQILVDGVDIKEYHLVDLRRHIAVVLQDVFLFAGDVKSNIRLKNEKISYEEIGKASKSIGADMFIEALPEAYNEVVMERGCTFSAGQKQLISFARAIAFNPSILVLDEATANIDTETEIVIQEAMKKLSRGRTSIIIAHRLSTIREADKIIVIHKGKIKEIGNHEELISKDGYYKKLCEHGGAVVA